MELTAVYRAVILATLVGSARLGVAQSPRYLSGRVVDSNGRPVSGASVRLQRNGSFYGAVNDAEGWFRFSVSADDTTTVVFLRIGYERRSYRLDSLEALLRRREDVVLSLAQPQFIDSVPPARPLNILDDTIPDLEHGAMARAAGLKPLYEHNVRSPREVRLTANFGHGAPDVMIVVRKGRHRISGEVFHAHGRSFGPGDRVDTTALVNGMRQSGCSQPQTMDESATGNESNYQHVTIVCRPHVRKTPNWSKVWRALERLDVWTLPDDDELTQSGVLVIHGACIAVETFDGKYRRIQHCEDSLVASPESVRAERLVKLVRSVTSTIR